MSILIYPYKAGSQSAKDLASALEIKRIKHTGSRFRGGSNHTVINWGASSLPVLNSATRIINSAESVASAINKVTSLQLLSDAGVTCLDSTTERGEAELWIVAGRKVFCRTLSRGNSGRGIVVATTSEELVNAPLYTAGISAFRKEFRVHVVNGVVTDWQAKRRRDGWVDDGTVDTNVRNHAAGWVFCRAEEMTPTEATKELAIKAVEAHGLDFGAVDLFEIGERNKRPMVIEVNTACGLTGTTLERYTEAFKEHYCG